MFGHCPYQTRTTRDHVPQRFPTLDREILSSKALSSYRSPDEHDATDMSTYAKVPLIKDTHTSILPSQWYTTHPNNSIPSIWAQDINPNSNPKPRSEVKLCRCLNTVPLLSDYSTTVLTCSDRCRNNQASLHN
jgi:hypothetical protein